jgi:hypothetical protein
MKLTITNATVICRLVHGWPHQAHPRPMWRHIWPGFPRKYGLNPALGGCDPVAALHITNCAQPPRGDAGGSWLHKEDV